MSELFEKSIRTLELPAVLEMLSARAVSEAAREKRRHVLPATDRQEVLRLLAVAEWLQGKLFWQWQDQLDGL